LYFFDTEMPSEESNQIQLYRFLVWHYSGKCLCTIRKSLLSP